MGNESSPGMFSACDGVATRSGDLVLLIARVLIGWLFFTGGWGALTNIAGAAGYLASLGVPAPGLMVWAVVLGELVIGTTLILGIAVRYASVLTIAFVIVATALAHRYWAYAPTQQANQYAHFNKNLAVIGGALLLFRAGAGRFSLDDRMR